MSRLYFHTYELGDLEIRGSERAHMAYIIKEVALAFLNPDVHEDRIRFLLPKDCYLHSTERGRQFDHDFRIWFSASFDGELGGNDIFELQLNTVYKAGGDVLKLFTRLHGQCEIHCWIAPEHVKWLAGIIDDGLASGLFRKGEGWEKCAESLRKLTTIYPVVCSYSVCEQFPNADIAGVDSETWYNLSLEDEWRLSVEKLVKSKGLQISPDNWDRFYYGKGTTVFDLLQSAKDAQPIRELP